MTPRQLSDDDRRLAAAIKSQDGFFTTFFVSPWSRYVARWLAQRGRTPNEVTVVSMVIGAAAAGAFSTGTRMGLIVGALLLYAAFVADCVDGQLARYTQNFSAFGAWLDSVFDRTKEYLVFAGLAYGAARRGEGDDIWLLAVAALTLLTVRHTIDASFEAVRHTAPGGSATALAGAGRAAISASAATEQHAWTKWPKRVVAFPIGERVAVICATAAVATPRITFIVVVTWTAVALAYLVTGRLLRSAT